MSFLQDRLFAQGQTNQMGWNKKLCWEAKDTLFSCVDRTENGNKFRCPDELYAYEMWCPAEMRRMTSHKKVREDLEATMYTQEMLDRLSLQKQTIWVSEQFRELLGQEVSQIDELIYFEPKPNNLICI